MGQSQQERSIRRALRKRRQRILDALGYVGLVLLIALIAHKHMSQAPRGPEPQVTTSAPITGAAVHLAADR